MKHQKQEEGAEQKVVQGVGRAIWSGIKRLFRVKRPTWEQQALEKRTQIAILKTGNESDLHRGVVEGDKLLDFILNHKGARGGQLGDKLKSSRHLFADGGSYQCAWDAHKVRNMLVHEYSSVGANSCRQAIDDYMKAYRGLGL